MDVFKDLVFRTPNRMRAVLVGVDGVDGSGKTTFSNRLAGSFEQAGRPVTVVHGDDFLHPRRIRYRRGRGSPAGFFHESINLEALRQKVLEPVREGVPTIIPKHFDHSTDVHVLPAEVHIDANTVVIVEGMFLHRDELAGCWDYSVFLDVPFRTSVGRMAIRDGSDPDPEHLTNRRYVEGQKLYFAECQPKTRARIVVDNSGYEPRIVALK